MGENRDISPVLMGLQIVASDFMPVDWAEM
jgi:hypothetical protein